MSWDDRDNSGLRSRSSDGDDWSRWRSRDDQSRDDRNRDDRSGRRDMDGGSDDRSRSWRRSGDDGQLQGHSPPGVARLRAPDDSSLGAPQAAVEGPAAGGDDQGKDGPHD